MPTGFQKVKTKYRRLAVICGVAGGVLCGLAVTGVLLIALKLSAVVWGWYLYLVVGVCAAALAACALCFAFIPSDAKLAKKLDERYSLDEQIRTRVEFAGDDGAVAALQRQTADDTLDNLPKRRPSVKKIIAGAASLIVALALFISGIVVPQRYEEEIEDPPYTVDATKLELLQELIDSLSDLSGGGTIDEDLSAAYAEELDALLANLKSEDLTEDKMTEYVHECMYNISDITIAANTYDDVARVISGCNSDAVEYIAEAVRSAAKASDEATIDLSSYENLSSAQTSVASLAAGYVESAGDTLTAEVNALSSGTLDAFSEWLTPYISAFESVLTDESLADYYNALIVDGNVTFGTRSRGSKTSGDDLYDSIYDLYYTFYYTQARINGDISPQITTVALAVKNIIGDGSDTDGEIYSFVINAGNALKAQAYVYLTDEYIRYTLGSIFGVTVVGNTADDGEKTAAEGGNGESSGGAGGTGETLYPGDDIIYNPDSGDYAYYYELLNGGYLTQLYELLDSDDISDEVKNYIRAYINELL